MQTDYLAKITLLSSLLAVVYSPVYAQTAQEKGREISQQLKERNEGWLDMTASMQMILRNKQGQESIREIRIKQLEVAGDGDKSLNIFDRPRDVKGTAFLSFSHTTNADEQWLYLPALKRVKRIASRNKSGPFMGSEFSYEDLTSFEIEKYTYKYINEEACDLGRCFVVEQYPIDKNSGYTKRIAWIDTLEYRVNHIEFYDRKNSLLKTLTNLDYQQYSDKFWRAGLMKMQNHQNQKSTDLQWSNYQFGTGLSNADFNKNTLKRAR